MLVDCEAPFANRHLLPRGLLREAPEQLRRAHIIFITKCDGRDLSELRAELRRYNGHAEFVECAHKPIHLEEISTHEIKPLEFLKELRVGAISGIARPESFEEGLRKLGADIIFARRFADHHRFSEGEIAKMLERSKTRGARALITTEKDIVRFPRVSKRLLPIYFLRVEIEIIRGHDAFDALRRPPLPLPGGRRTGGGARLRVCQRKSVILSLSQEDGMRLRCFHSRPHCGKPAPCGIFRCRGGNSSCAPSSSTDS